MSETVAERQTVAGFSLWLAQQAEQAWGEAMEAARRQRETGVLSWATAEGQNATTRARWAASMVGWFTGNELPGSAAYGESIGSDGLAVDRFGRSLGREPRGPVASNLARSLEHHSRFSRWVDGVTTLYDDSVPYMEYDLARHVAGDWEMAQKYGQHPGQPDHVRRRLVLESELTCAAVVAYCGIGMELLTEVLAVEDTARIDRAHYHGGSTLLSALAVGRPVR